MLLTLVTGWDDGTLSSGFLRACVERKAFNQNNMALIPTGKDVFLKQSDVTGVCSVNYARISALRENYRAVVQMAILAYQNYVDCLEEDLAASSGFKRDTIQFCKAEAAAAKDLDLCGVAYKRKNLDKIRKEVTLI